MITLRDKTIWAAAAVTLAIMSPGAASSKVLLTGSHRTQTLDCAGGVAQIGGSHNQVTLTGGCTRLTIVGSYNKVTLTGGGTHLTIHGSWNTATVAFTANGSISFAGFNNEVIWTTPDGKAPKILRHGHRNTLKEGQAQ